MSIRVLIVEDEALIRWSLRKKFEERGYQVSEAETGEDAIQLLSEGDFDLVMLDYQLPDMTGLDVLRRLRERDADAVAIMMTAYSTIKTAVDAVRLGAFDYLAKPFQMDELLFTVDKALETTKLRRELRALRSQLQRDFGSDMLIGQHGSIQSLLDTIQRVAASGASTVLIRGETGTGKDLVARLIHGASPRARQPFINITCTAISDTLLESELFGHERGAFTDAKTQKKGLLEAADGGSVFLDEIGDMAPALQAKLLRFLEERRFRRVGGTQEISVDVRVIAATNRPIEEAIRDGKFREDLFYRLNVVSLSLPPLRERGDDVKLLARHFATRFASEFKKPPAEISEQALSRLAAHSWPGNVRELRNAVERALLLSKSRVLNEEDFVLSQRADAVVAPVQLENFALPAGGFPLSRLDDLEKSLLKQALERTRNNQVQAAELLGVSRDRLRYRMQKYGLL